MATLEGTHTHSMEGKNCFRTRWTQEPIFSGGNIASLAVPQRSFEHIASSNANAQSHEERNSSSAAQSKAQNDTSSTLPGSGSCGPGGVLYEECLVLACGDSVNVVRASTGELVCSYTLPVEDVVLHVDAVSVLSTEHSPVPFGQQAMSRATAPAKRQAGKATKKNKASHDDVKEEEDADASGIDDANANAAAPELRVPVGCYVACGTQALQLYLFSLSVTETIPLSSAPAKTSDETDGEAAPREESVMDPVVSYELKLVRSWTASVQAICVVSFSAGGQFLISGSTDGSVKVWNAFHHHLTHNFRCPSGSLLQTVYLDPSESYLVTGSFEGHVTVFDFVEKTIVAHARPHVQAVESVALSEDGEHLYTIARDRRLSIQKLSPPSEAQRLQSGKRRRAHGEWTLTEQRAIVVKEHLSTALFEDAHTLHIGSLDGILTTYKLDSATAAVTVACRSEKPPATDAADTNEEATMRCILVGGRPKGSARSPVLRGFTVDDSRRSTDALFVADAGFNVLKMVRSSDGSRYDSTGALVGFLDQILDIKAIPAPAATRTSAARVLVNNSKDVRLYGTSGCLSRQTLRGHTDIVMCCAVSADGSLISTAGKDKEVRFWSTETFATVAKGVKGHTAEITSMSFNAKQTSSYLLLFTIAADENLRLWDVAANVLPRLAHGKPEATGARGAAAPEDFEHRAGVNSAHSGPVFALAVAPNDQYVATGGKDKVVNLWNVTGKKIFKESTLKGHRRGVSALAFSPADRVLASAANDGTVRLWSLVSLTCVRTLQADKVAVLQLAFFNAGTQLVTGNAEGVLRVWAVAASEAVWTSELHQEKVWALAVTESAGETVFLSGSADGVLVATEDYTTEEAERMRTDRHDVVLKEQALSNAMRKGEFSQAFSLALQLNHPRHLRQVLVRWCAVDAAQCEEVLCTELLPSLSEEFVVRLLQFTREWMTNSRHSMVASLVVFCFLRSQHFQDLAQLAPMQSLIEPLLAYSQRHSQRQHELLHRTYYIDYVAQGGGTSSKTLTTMPPFVDAKGTRVVEAASAVPQRAAGGKHTSPSRKKARA